MTAFQLDKHTDRSRLCFLILSILLAYAYFADDQNSTYFIFALAVVAFSDAEKADSNILRICAIVTYVIYIFWVLYVGIRWFYELFF
ncbi:hypothetical protein ACI2JA_08230 [Alkalihalobacillus sp. NPDC078783]